MIIGLCGKIGSGKSTACSYLENKYGYTEYEFADPLKEIGRIFHFSEKQLYGTQEEKLQIHPHWGISARTFLQKVGTEVFRQALPKIIPEMRIDGTVWVDLFKLNYTSNPRNMAVSGVRFQDEAEAIRSLGGIIIRTVRTNTTSSSSRIEHVHPSELELEKIKEDYILNNDLLTLEQAQLYLDNILIEFESQSRSKRIKLTELE